MCRDFLPRSFSHQALHSQLRALIVSGAALAIGWSLAPVAHAAGGSPKKPAPAAPAGGARPMWSRRSLS